MDLEELGGSNMIRRDCTELSKNCFLKYFSLIGDLYQSIIKVHSIKKI